MFNLQFISENQEPLQPVEIHSLRIYYEHDLVTAIRNLHIFRSNNFIIESKILFDNEDFLSQFVEYATTRRGNLLISAQNNITIENCTLVSCSWEHVESLNCFLLNAIWKTCQIINTHQLDNILEKFEEVDWEKEGF